MKAFDCAAQYLEAVQVDPQRYAFIDLFASDDGRRPWRTTTAMELTALGRALRHSKQYDDEALEWSLAEDFDLRAPRMPEWWSPERREAWRAEGIFDEVVIERADALVEVGWRNLPLNNKAYRVTACIETGKELQIA